MIISQTCGKRTLELFGLFIFLYVVKEKNWLYYFLIKNFLIIILVTPWICHVGFVNQLKQLTDPDL